MRGPQRLRLVMIFLSGFFPLIGHSTTLKECFSPPIMPVTYQATYNNELSAGDNVIGSSFAVNYLEGAGSDQEANCKCTGGIALTTSVTELTAIGSPLMPGGSGRAYLTDHLDLVVAGYTDDVENSTNPTLIPIDVYPTPLDKMQSRLDLHNNEKTATVCSDATRPDGASTIKRKFRWNNVSLSFTITKPIFGQEVIPPTVVAQYYACLYYNSACTLAETQHVSDVVLSGLITAPVSCTISQGGTINVDLGEITTPQFIHKGQTPADYTLKDVDITYHCDDRDAWSSTDKIKLTLIADQGVAEGSQSLIAKMMGRDDIGVRMYDDKENNVVLDGTVYFPVTLDENGDGHIKMTAAPVSTTDQRPAPGKFEGNVTVKMEIK